MRQRPSPALVVSLIALFVALGGTGYAALKINGKDIANRSIPAGKVKKNSLGGSEIRESKLAKVPAARRADNAQRLGGKSASDFASGARFFHIYTTAPRGEDATVLRRGPFRVVLNCSAGTSISGEPTARARLRIIASQASLESFTTPGTDTPQPADTTFETAQTAFGTATQNRFLAVGGYIDSAGGRTLDISSRLRVNGLGRTWCHAVTQGTYGGN